MEMKFMPLSFTITDWEIDKNTIEILKELDETGIHLTAKDLPTFQPIVETFRNNKLPIAFLTIKWDFLILSSDENPILKYSVEDKFQFTPHEYNNQDIKDLIIDSYREFGKQYDKLREGSGIPPGIPSLEQSEFSDLQLETLRILKEKGV